MTENLLQKLEEKMMLVLTEMEDLRKEVQRLSHENAAFKQEKEGQMRKLQDLVSLLDSVNTVDNAIVNINIPVAPIKPALVQNEG